MYTATETGPRHAAACCRKTGQRSVLHCTQVMGGGPGGNEEGKAMHYMRRAGGVTRWGCCTTRR